MYRSDGEASLRHPSPLFAILAPFGAVRHHSPPFGAVLLRRPLHLPAAPLSPPSFSAQITFGYEQKSCFQVAHFLFHGRRWTIPSNHKKTSFFMMFCLRFVLSLHCKSVSREQSAVCRVVVRNFRRDGSRPTAYGVQALFANHFMLL